MRWSHQAVAARRDQQVFYQARALWHHVTPGIAKAALGGPPPGRHGNVACPAGTDKDRALTYPSTYGDSTSPAVRI